MCGWGSTPLSQRHSSATKHLHHCLDLLVYSPSANTVRVDLSLCKFHTPSSPLDGYLYSSTYIPLINTPNCCSAHCSICSPAVFTHEAHMEFALRVSRIKFWLKRFVICVHKYSFSRENFDKVRITVHV